MVYRASRTTIMSNAAMHISVRHPLFLGALEIARGGGGGSGSPCCFPRSLLCLSVLSVMWKVAPATLVWVVFHLSCGFDGEAGGVSYRDSTGGSSGSSVGWVASGPSQN